MGERACMIFRCPCRQSRRALMQGAVGRHVEWALSSLYSKGFRRRRHLRPNATLRPGAPLLASMNSSMWYCARKALAVHRFLSPCCLFGGAVLVSLPSLSPVLAPMAPRRLSGSPAVFTSFHLATELGGCRPDLELERACTLESCACRGRRLFGENVAERVAVVGKRRSAGLSHACC